MANEERKASLSFEENRKNLLNDLQASASTQVIEKRVTFDCDDVPTFLGRLKQFELKSRETILTIR